LIPGLLTAEFKIGLKTKMYAFYDKKNYRKGAKLAKVVYSFKLGVFASRRETFSVPVHPGSGVLD
jgi:hypothetical protein